MFSNVLAFGKWFRAVFLIFGTLGFRPNTSSVARFLSLGVWFVNARPVTLTATNVVPKDSIKTLHNGWVILLEIMQRRHQAKQAISDSGSSFRPGQDVWDTYTNTRD